MVMRIINDTVYTRYGYVWLCMVMRIINIKKIKEVAYDRTTLL